MSTEDFIYLSLLLTCIPFGHLVKLTQNRQLKTLLVLGAGLLVGLIVVGYKGLAHSFITITINYVLITVVGPRNCHVVSFIFVFAYLFFFRTCEWFGLPTPPPYSNALQLLVTLRTISVSFEIHDHHENQRKDEKDRTKSYHLKPTFVVTILDYYTYCYCYIGQLTGPFYTYRTYSDMIYVDGSNISTVWPAIRNLKILSIFLIPYLLLAKHFPLSYLNSDDYINHPWGLIYQLLLLLPTFSWFRWRFYFAWVLSESMCMTAGLGAYPFECNAKPAVGPTQQVPDQFDPVEAAKGNIDGDTHSFSTIHNIDIYGVEMAPTMKYAMKKWNMTVQWWMATYVYKKMPLDSPQIRMFLLLFVSAYWHGVHPGYYLTFMSVPLVVIAETRMIKAIKPYLNSTQSYWLDWITWFCLYRSFEYTGIGFMLLKLDFILKVWLKMYFIGHLFIFAFILLPVFIPRKKTKSAENENGSRHKIE